MTRALNVQRLALILWPWLLCIAPQMCAQQSSDAGGPALPRIQRYLSLEMYSEAEAALRPAVTANEFNGELRFLYGSALQGLRKYDEAISNFRLSLRLDKGRWQAVEHVVQCYKEKYAVSLANQDRVLLGEAATQLALIPPDSPADSDSRRDLREAQRRSQALLTVLNSPVGTWGNGSLHLSVSSSADSDSIFKISSKAKESLMAGTFRRLENGGFQGSGISSKTICVFDIEFTLQLLDAGTKLLIQEQNAKYRGPDPLQGDPSPADLQATMRARDKVCRD